MKNKIKSLFVLAVLVSFFVTGCGTTVDEVLGDPPAQPQWEATAYPMGGRIGHEKFSEGVVLKGNQGCVEPGAMVLISNSDTEELARTLADSYGAFNVTLDAEKVPDDSLLLFQAQGKDKDLSSYTRYSLNPFAGLV